MLRTAVLVGIITTLCVSLSGCGQKGDLYMPAQQASVMQNAFFGFKYLFSHDPYTRSL